MTTRKWKLSPYWWANFWFLLAMALAAEAGLLFIYLNWEWPKEDLFLIPAVFMPCVILVFLLSALHPWRFLMTIEADNGVYRSFLFGRLAAKSSRTASCTMP